MSAFFKKIIVLVLNWEARLVLHRYKPRVIAITGSVGKTTSKDAIFATLHKDLNVRKSEKSHNSEFGVPLTILGLGQGRRNPFIWLWNLLKGLYLIIIPQTYPDWLVLEVGADRPGDIKKIARWLRPDIAVITAIPEIPVHVEFFDSPKAVWHEKRSLVKYLKPGGTLIINGDDSRLSEIRTDFRGTKVTFGLDQSCDYGASHEEITYEAGLPIGMRFRVNHSGSSVPVEIHGALGTPRVYAGLVALAVAGVLGIDLVSAASALALFQPTPGRMRLLPGLRGSLIIDDTYNSSPAAALSALDTLKEIKGAKRKIAIMGDMLELGKYAAEAHGQVGARAAACTDMLITVGFRARAIAESALDNGMRDDQIRQYEQNEAARVGKELESELGEGDIILIKGSQNMRMERTVLEIMSEPIKAAELLVRQEEEWMTR